MKKKAFFENAKILNDEFNVSPLMYGSLGLEYISDEDLNSDDIDILIPSVYLNEKWNTFIDVLNKYNYVLVDEHEHCFDRCGINYSYASIEELEDFCDIKLNDIRDICEEGINFKLLSLKQYLKVYNKSIEDGYRINVRKKKDSEKIKFIEALLKKEEND
jgi:hypothetical protein